MSLSLTKASTNKITVTNPHTIGSGSSFSYLQWVRNRATPGGSEGTGKGNLDIFVWSNLGRWFQYVPRATTASETAVTTANMFPSNNVWYFIVTTYSEANGIKIYRGDLTTAPVEMTYVINTIGSGATTADSGDLYIGNRGAGNSLAPPHDLYNVAWYDSELTLGQVQSLWMDPRVIAGTKFFFNLGDNGTSTQPDYSGNGKSGAVTGATQVDNPPLRRRWGQRVVVAPYAVAAPAFTPRGLWFTR